MTGLNFLFPLFQWGAKALKNMLIVPPGSGIVHQVNLEYLARVVFNENRLLYPDSLVGTDSHTTMINGLGIVGWGEFMSNQKTPGSPQSKIAALTGIKNHITRKPVLGVWTRLDLNRPAQLQKLARVLKCWL